MNCRRESSSHSHVGENACTKVMLTRQALFILLCSALLAASCGQKVKETAAEAKEKITEAKQKATEKMLESLIERKTGEKVKVDVSKERINITGEKGEVTFTRDGGGELPEGFPEDVHIYKDATIVMSATHLTTFSLVLRTKDSFDKVANTYRKEMTSQGWEENAVDNTTGTSMLQYIKDKRSVTVRRVDDKEKKTQVLLVVRGEDE